MKYGFCNLAIAPLRALPSEKAEQVSQLLFGDAFSVLEENEDRFFIENFDDKHKGWIDKKQVILISEEEFFRYTCAEKYFTKDSISFVTQTKINSQEKIIYPIYLGSQIFSKDFTLGNIRFEIPSVYFEKPIIKNSVRLISIAIKYISTPYLWGGKSLFGIDCSGFSQMCYKQIGINILRDASEQVTQGEEINNISYAVKGDLCFFSNSEGKITHVGIYLGDNKIIHSSGQVRIDFIDNKGILVNNTYSHNLCRIKRLL